MPGLVTVNFNGASFAVSFSPSWTIAQLKGEIGRQKNVHAGGIKIIFAGQELPDTWQLKVNKADHWN